MLFFPLALAIIAILLRYRRPEHLVLALIPVFAMSQLPSELKSLFVLAIGGGYVYLQDVLLLGFLSLLVLEPKSRRIDGNGKMDLTMALFLLYVVAHLLQISFVWVRQGLESSFLRFTLSGALWLSLCLLNYRSEAFGQGRLGLAFTIHNLIVALSAVLVGVAPEMNDIESDLASYLGFSSTGYEDASFILVSALSAVMCVISLWYFLFVERRQLLSPVVALPLLLVMASSHRIDYLALSILLFVYAWQRLRGHLAPRRTGFLVKFLLLAVYGAATWKVLDVVGFELVRGFFEPFVDRATSLFAGTQTDTVDERVSQYSYFFTDYLSKYENFRYIFGEGYLTTPARDGFYAEMQPHNFMLSTLLNSGVLGALFIGAILVSILSRRIVRQSHFMLPFALLMVTQMTDAAFTHYPISAYFALLLGLARSESAGVYPIGAPEEVGASGLRSRRISGIASRRRRPGLFTER